MSEMPQQVDPILVSDIWEPVHLLALGRIVQVSASLEMRLRSILGRALGLTGPGNRNEARADAAFLGCRVPDMYARLTAASRIAGAPPWVPAAVLWAKRVDAATKRRDALIHRSPGVARTPDGLVIGMAAARKNQTFEALDGQPMDVLRELVRCLDDLTPLFELIVTSEQRPTGNRAP